MIYIALGSNRPSRFGTPVETLGAAMGALCSAGIQVVQKSGFWESAPVPASEQDWYVNAVVAVETALPPVALLAVLKGIEKMFGREDAPVRNAPRVLDLDLLAYHDLIVEEVGVVVPHPRAHERAFVLVPLQEIAPDWKHPVTREGIAGLISRLSAEQCLFPAPKDIAV